MEQHFPITATKIFVPRRREEILSRPRLLDLLKQWSDLRLIIVAAPAGYGKTSLLVDFASQSRMPVCWLGLDLLDQTLPRLVAHLIASIRQNFPAFGIASLAALQGWSAGSLQDEALVSMIANDLYEHTPEHFFLILDDYHLIEESRPVVQFLNDLIQRVDENCHFIISSRTLLNLPDMPLLVARSQVGGLSFEELAFQPAEIQQLWLRNFQIPLSEQEAAQLARDTEGWITGILLSHQAPGGRLEERLRGARVAGVGLYEYLAQQVLERQPPQMQEFLLHTSLLEEFDAELCQEVLGEPPEGMSWQAWMEQALRANLFIQPVGTDRIFLRYHHLFRDFLQARIARLHPERTQQILLTLAEVWAKRGEWERAYAVYRRLGQEEWIAYLVERAATDLIARGNIQTLGEWLEALPETYRNRPAILSSLGTVYVTRGNTPQGIQLLDRAIVAYQNSEDKPGLARTLVRRATALRLQGNYLAAMEDTRQALEVMSGSEGEASLRGDALNELGLANFYLGHPQDALNVLEQAADLFRKNRDAESAAKNAMHRGMVARAMGCFGDAERFYHEALHYYQKNQNLIWQANVLNNLGVLKQYRGDYEGAALAFEKVVQYAHLAGYNRLEAYGLAGIAELYRDLNATAEARQACQRARAVASQIDDRFLLFYLNLLEASLSILEQNWTQARRELELARSLMGEGASPYQQQLFTLAQAHLALHHHPSETALAELRRARKVLEDASRRTDSLHATCLVAGMAYLLKDTYTACRELSTLHEALQDADLNHTATLCALQIRHVLAAMRESECSGMVLELQEAISAFERRIPLLKQALRRHLQTVPLGPPKLSIQTLGKVQIRLNGRLVPNSAWVTKTSRELFLLLVASPEGLSKEQIGEILWPDSEPEDLNYRFKNAIYRLRRAVGKEAILWEGDIYRFNRALDYEEDAEIFLKEIELAETSDDLEKTIAHYQQAIRLYRGAYLPDVEGSWAHLRRQKLRGKYLQGLLQLANLEFRHKHYEEALNAVQKLLEEDACMEEAHRLAMLIYAAMGNRTAVMRQYEACQAALKREFNALPSEETRQLFKMLTR